MSKITRDAMAFTQRVKMSQHRVFLLVEGRDLDARFYDKILATSDSIRTAGYVVHLGELVSLDGVSAGGKKHLLNLHDAFKAAKKLTQSREDGENRVIAIAADKDLDDITGRKRRSSHIIYTRHADVEAEVFAHCRLKKTLASALSLDEHDAKRFKQHVGDPLDELASRWSEWIELCIRAEGLSARCAVRIASRSVVNASNYGPFDPEEFLKVENQVLSRARHSTGRDAQMKARAASARHSGAMRLYIKGKQIPGFLKHLAREHFSSIRPVSLGTFDAAVTAVALSTVRFDPAWTRHWTTPLEKL